jgi:UDP-N-acetylglucosamine--N-acetylmuramyl-(pentapeptide) pyrophosphoryl-undecaprenol N-acetylglucosamine transferase
MAKAMLASDLVICRAGATTVAELAAVGRPSILVPLRTSDEHQGKNADALVTVGAAMMITGGEVAAALVAHVKTLAVNRKQRSEMGAAARQLARPAAAARIVDRALELVHS